MSAEEVQPIGPIAHEAIEGIKQRAKERSMSKTDEQVLAERDDAEMIRRPHLWPTPGLLPIKRPQEQGLPQPAVLGYDRGEIVVLENMTVMGTSLGRDVVQHRFTDAEDVLMQGWVVD